jgi:type II secretory pathway predicted ATPase ExeA
MSTTTSNQSIPPFPPFPSVARLVELGSAKDAISRVSRAIRSNESLSLVIGPPGVGKSLVCNAVANEFSETHDVVMLGEIPITDAASYYRAVLHHLGVDFQNIPVGDLYVSLVDRITGHAMTQGQLVIVVDEAQSLSAEVLDAIRTTTNIMKDQQPCVSAVVCGGVKLEDTLATAAMESFTQRVATRCYLHPLNASETRQYISESIRACGSVPDETMTDEAMGAVHHACNGVPRLINQMMTEAIDCAADAGQSLIDEKVIDRAWATLQQLPSPMVEEQKIVHQSAPVEFAALSELEEMQLNAPSTQNDLENAGDAAAEDSSSFDSDSVLNVASESTSEEETLEEAEVRETGDLSNEARLASVAAGGVDSLAAGGVDSLAAGGVDSSASEAQGSDQALLGDLNTDDPMTSESDASATEETATESGETESYAMELGETNHTVDGVASGESNEAVESQPPALRQTQPVIAQEQPIVVSGQRTPDALQLFGEFEVEESLAVQGELQPSDGRRVSEETVSELRDESGSEEIIAEFPGVQSEAVENDASDNQPAHEPEPAMTPESSQVNAPAVGDMAQATGYDAPQDIAHSGSIDFEASLHDEVLLLNEMATQARFGGIEPENTFANADSQGISPHEQPAIWLAEDDILPEQTDHSGHADMRRHDERPMPPVTGNAAEFSDMQIINDDSDMLIIEDEMSIVPRPYTASSTESETTVNVDFQAMLSKMRTGA